MSQASLQMRQLARRLVQHESERNRSSKSETSDVFGACENLRPQLVTLMGNGGFHALLSRALALSTAAVPWLGALHLKADGSVNGLGVVSGQLSSDALLAGRIEVLAQLLGLLEAFIGEDLTIGLVREAWPKAPLEKLSAANGIKK